MPVAKSEVVLAVREMKFAILYGKRTPYFDIWMRFV